MSTTRTQPPNAEAIRIGDQWYVAATAARADESPHVLKCDDSFALFDRFGDIRAFGAGEQGLYHEDTRFLSRLELTIDGVRPLFLGAAVKERNNLLIVELMNPDLRQGGRIVVPKGQLHVFRAKLLWDGACHEHIRITNHGLASASLEVALSFDADFRDLFEVRGMPRTRHGRLAEPVRSEDGGIAFGYEGLDGQHRTARITFEPAPQRCEPHEAAWALALEPQAEWHLFCTVACDFDTRVAQGQHEGAPHAVRQRPPHELQPRERPREQSRERRQRPPTWEAAIHANAQARAHRETAHCRLETSNPLLDRWIERSVSDLAMLTTELPTGPYPYAGVPWYSTVFGRDGLITARQVLWADPTLARGVLACMAARQATASDPARDAEPGKILHEARQCEMALTGEVPFERYYGTVDATPLFVALAGAYWRRSGDIDFARSLWPHVTAAMEWIDRHGDRDGDGFVEYARRSAEGLVQQGWKDSHDSIFHADGALAEAPIALAEVQGYVYEAKLEAAALAEVLGEPERAAKLREEAARLQREFQRRFWCEDLGVYALALDGAKRPCKVATTNAGHALWTGLAAPEHAARMAERFVAGDFFSGWGIRTVARGEKRYNPMSYHNGSVWPHDNALVAAGLARYGHANEALAVFSALFEATLHLNQHRMPELFCGFPRREGEGPVLYPVACVPQAWSAAAVFSLLEGCLGLHIDAPQRALSFRAPRLPEWVDWLEIRGLAVAGATASLLLERHGDNVSVRVTRKTGRLAVHVEV